MNKSKVATKPSILRQFPEPVLNNTTINNLGASEDPIEIFPPEIFFKGNFVCLSLGSLSVS